MWGSRTGFFSPEDLCAVVIIAAKGPLHENRRNGWREGSPMGRDAAIALLRYFLHAWQWTQQYRQILTDYFVESATRTRTTKGYFCLPMPPSTFQLVSSPMMGVAMDCTLIS